MIRWVKLLSWAGEEMCLLTELSGVPGVLEFWGTAKIDSTTGKYRVAAYTPDRKLKTVEEPIDTLEEAQTAVEKFLFDNGTLKEGDEVEYE